VIKPKVCVLRAAGTNCDQETANAFNLAGAEAELLHINNLAGGKTNLEDYQILALPGGFSYGDDIASGKIFANELKFKLAGQIKQFIRDGKLIIGICNGFQILAKSAFLPGNEQLKQDASLIINDSGKFEDRWVYLRKSPSKCVWTKRLAGIIYLPVAHGEGKFITRDKKALQRLKDNGQVVFRYCNQDGASCVYPENPNGSQENIAGICDETGRVLGLMPHPERHVLAQQNPKFRQLNLKSKKLSNNNLGQGYNIFRNGVKYVQDNL